MSGGIRTPVGRSPSDDGPDPDDVRDSQVDDVPDQATRVASVLQASESEIRRNSQRGVLLSLGRLNTWYSGKVHELVSALKSARKRDGFLARLTTMVLSSILVGALLMVFAPSMLLMLVGILGVIVLDGIFLRKTIRDAYMPSATAPEGAVIPDEGFPAFRYRIHQLYGFADRVPSVTESQQAREDEKNRLREEAEASESELEAQRIAKARYKLIWDRVRYIYNLGIHPTIAIVAQKGAACKTFSGVNIGNMIADEIRCQVILMPGSASTQSATAGRVAGVKGNTLSQREFYDELSRGAEFVYRSLHKLIAKTKYGLSVIAEDGQGKWRSHFGYQKWRAIFEQSSANADIFIIDTGNEDALKDTVSTEAIKVADVVLVPGSVDQDQTLDMVGSTIGNYAALDLFNEKLRRAVAVFHGVKPDEDMKNYTELLSESLREVGADPRDFRDIMVFGIRWDDYLKRNSRGIDFRLMDEGTQLDYSAVILALFEQASALQGVVLSERDPLIAGDLCGLAIPSDHTHDA